MAYRLRDRFRHRLLFVHSLGWHFWDGQRWAFDDTGTSTRAVITVLKQALATALGDRQLQADVKKCESARGISGVLEIASALEPFAATVRDLDADPFLLNVANGTLDLRTLELRPHDPQDRITKVAGGAYTPDVTGATWYGFLRRVLPDETVRAYLQRLIGLALLGEVREHVLPIWTGTGRNGKTTTYAAISHAMGGYACTAEPDLFMQRPGAHPTGEMDLMGRRFVVVSESAEGRRLDETKVKRLTGGDPIRARRMRENFVEFQPAHLPVLITNHLPSVRGDDPAIWARIRVIPFTVVIPKAEQDGGLPGRLQTEADAILTWAVAGWQAYRSAGDDLREPEAVLVATADYQLSSDNVRRFIEDECVTGPAVQARTSALFAKWEHWATREGAEPVSMKAFGQQLDRLGHPVKKQRDANFRIGIGLLMEGSQ
jgi:putative DNA primase/helicase